MSLRINTNTDALNSYRNLSATQSSMSSSLEKLSSGYRINRAADDAAGLAISEGLKSQIGGIKVAVRNAQDGVSVVQTAEGALSESQSILQRMRDLAVQSANDSNDDTSRKAIDAESSALKDELTRISSTTKFNNVSLLDGSYANKDFQVGYASGDKISVSISSSSTATAGAETWAASTTAAAGDVTFTQGTSTATVTLAATDDTPTKIKDKLNADTDFAAAYTASVDGSGKLVVTAKDATADFTVGGTALTGGTYAAKSTTAKGFSATDLGVGTVDLSTKAGANSAIDAIDTAIKSISTARANLGAVQNRFDHTINTLNVTSENLTSSQSRITDTDMASEMMNYTRAQIMSQAGTAMLAQANSAPQNVLTLLRG